MCASILAGGTFAPVPIRLAAEVRVVTTIHKRTTPQANILTTIIKDSLLKSVINTFSCY